MESGQNIKDIKNLGFSDRQNEIRDLEENLDKYPFPDYDFKNHYTMKGSRCMKIDQELIDSQWDGVYCIMTSRGCPYSCSYCYNNYRRKIYQNKGKYVRFRSPENIIKELKWAKERFPDIRLIKFWDDLFLACPKLTEFIELYEKEIGIKFDCMSTPVYITEEKILMLKKAGMQSIHIGIQSGSENVNKNVYCRHVPNNLLLEKARLLNRLGIDARYDIIFNNPYETREELMECIDFLSQMPKPFKLQGFSLVFFPGTEIYDRALKDELITLFDNESNDSRDLFKYMHLENKDNVFYSLNFSSDDKKYLNKLIMLTPFVSRKRILHLMKHENQINRAFADMLYYRKYVASLAVSRFANRHKTTKRIGKAVLRRK
jgi:radical SAM superfamily enzyme YgiQ (UPF0313 family)